MAIFSGAAGKKTNPRGNVLQGSEPRAFTRAFPPLRVTGTVRIYGESPKKTKS